MVIKSLKSACLRLWWMGHGYWCTNTKLKFFAKVDEIYPVYLRCREIVAAHRRREMNAIEKNAKHLARLGQRMQIERARIEQAELERRMRNGESVDT